MPTPTITAFIAALNAGVKSWETAGAILVALRQEDPEVFKRIIKEHPFVTEDTLHVFHNIGTRSLYPMVLLLPRHASLAVRRMDYDKQVAVCDEPVEIVTRMAGDKPVVIHKPITQMTAAECKRVLWRKGVMSKERQIRDLTTPRPITLQEITPQPKSSVFTRTPNTVGRYAVRRAIGGGFVFEKTMANPSTTQRILLTDGQAVIELTEYGKNQP